MTPTAKFVLLAILITVFAATIMYLLDVPWGYPRLGLVFAVSAFVLFLLAIADRLRNRKWE